MPHIGLPDAYKMLEIKLLISVNSLKRTENMELNF